MKISPLNCGIDIFSLKVYNGIMFDYSKKIAVISAFFYALVCAVIFALSLTPGDQSVKQSNFIYSVYSFFRYGRNDVPKEKNTPITSLSISTTKSEYFVGNKTTVIFDRITPEDHTETVVLKSSDESVINVENHDLIFVGEGVAEVFAESSGGVRSNAITLTVLKNAPITVDPSLFSLNVPDSLYLNDSVALGFKYDEKPSDLSVSYSVDNENFILKNGYLISACAGNSTLALIYNGEVVAQKSITALSESLLQPIISELFLGENAVGEEITLILGKAYVLSARFENENCCKLLNFKRSDPIVGAALSADKTTVRMGALKCGETTVEIVSPVNGGTVLKTFTVKIIPPRPEIAKIDIPSPVYAGRDLDLSPSVSDANMLEGLKLSATQGEKNCRINGYCVSFDKEGYYSFVFTSDYYEDFEYKISFIVNDWKVSTDIRKNVGHAALFVVLGVFAVLCFCYFFKKPVYKAIITVLSGLVVSIVSEILQLPIFTVGRSASVADAFINAAGFAIGAAIVLSILLIVYFIRKSKRRSASSKTVE